jgi:peptidoglycan hydrolase-like protein with peptidoglycan-binding domain
MPRCTTVAAVLLAAAVLGCAQTSTPSSSPAAAPTARTGASSPKRTASSHKSKKSHKTASKRGQQKIDPQRARQIQEALVREHYLNGKPSGVWDSATQAAMQKYQADNGWQSKTTPDARALIKMGLGPDHDHLLNPESAMTSQPPAASSAPKSDPSSDSGKTTKVN